jgi:hypothetical protein
MLEQQRFLTAEMRKWARSKRRDIWPAGARRNGIGMKVARKYRAPSKQKRRVPDGSAAFCLIVTCKEELLVLGRPGSDLLSQGLSHSTIGAEEFNGRVRDGIGFMLLARTTRPAKDKETKQAVERCALWANGE